MTGINYLMICPYRVPSCQCGRCGRKQQQTHYNNVRRVRSSVSSSFVDTNQIAKRKVIQSNTKRFVLSAFRVVQIEYFIGKLKKWKWLNWAVKTIHSNMDFQTLSSFCQPSLLRVFLVSTILACIVRRLTRTHVRPRKKIFQSKANHSDYRSWEKKNGKSV